MSAAALAGDAATTVIRLRGVTRRFGTVEAVAGIDLEVAAGSITALLGPSGCGKTTVLRLIAGFEVPDAGTVEVDGAVVAGPGRFVAPEHRRVGMVFQEYALFPHLDVTGNVAFGLPRRGAVRAQRRQRVAQVLHLVGLAGLGDRYPHELSGGQQQRVALARALAPQPAVVLLDEPFSSLDAGLRARVRADVAGILRTAGATAVFVTHDQEEALAIAHRVVVLRDGRVLQQAAPEALYLEPRDREVAAFMGEADFVHGDARGDRVATALGSLSLARPVHGAVDVLLRPEHLRVTADAAGSGLVEGREFYGHDQMLFLRLDDGLRLRARLGPVSDLRPGDRCTVSVDTPVSAYPRR